MEKPSPTAPFHALALTEPIALLFYQTLSFWFLHFHKLSLRLLSLLALTSPTAPSTPTPAPATARTRAGIEGIVLTREDVEAVMEAMGLLGGDRVEERVDGAELAALFEEREASLEEVEAAFLVFDEGRDGFIDTAELQRALSKLGFMEGATLDACAQMIAAFDENGDGRIDFEEFVKFMHSTFC